MPVQPTYPGVYIEEVPSGVRAITGVATSIAAFLGRAKRGQVNHPITITSYGDFERIFGGLHPDYPMSYSVRDFFANGGSQAVIVRLYPQPAMDEEAEDEEGEGEAGEGAEGEAGEGEDAAEPAATKAMLERGALLLEAASQVEWGNQLRMRVTSAVPTVPEGEEPPQVDLPSWAEMDNLTVEDLFNLEVYDAGTGNTESFVNVTMVESRRRVDRVLQAQSNLVRVSGEHSADADVPEAHGEPESRKDNIWASDELSTGVTDENAVEEAMSLATGDYTGDQDLKTGMYALEKADLFNLLCIPWDQRGVDTSIDVYDQALNYCVERRAMLIVDPPVNWSANPDTAAAAARDGLDGLGLKGQRARNAAIYFPMVLQADPMRDGQIDTFVPCGIMAGVMARTDVTRGVWKAPAGVDATLSGIRGLNAQLTDAENGILNPLGINCLRTFPIIGSVAWGARTMRGADQLADEYKYLPVRRLVLFIEESLYRGTQWVVFEPNDEPLWAQIRMNVGTFMNRLFKQGAFQGSSPADAYFVKCDSETTPQADIDLGIVNIHVGFAPLKPAEFVILRIQQIANQGN